MSLRARMPLVLESDGIQVGAQATTLAYLFIR